MSKSLLQEFIATRDQSVRACEVLAIEDYGLQAEAFTSPPKWHLAHTSWFFETFVLKPFLENYKATDEKYEVLFNSYYNGIGEQFPRPKRGLLSRPTVAEIMDYRQRVDGMITTLLGDEGHPNRGDIIVRCKLGIEHEQQHQELFYTDLKYSLAENPLLPTFSEAMHKHEPADEVPLQWLEYAGGLKEIGYQGKAFAFDNELPRHKTFIEPYMLANRLVTNLEYQHFIDDGGYQRAELWLADGWTTLQEAAWQGPHYWLDSAEPREFTLHGVVQRGPGQPVCHISGYEADAYARWAGARLPTESEWEHAAALLPVETAGVDDGIYHPQAATSGDGLLQLYGDCWQWTQSAYSPYPGFKHAAGAIGEYNGKFMSNQWVLRGGSCVSKRQHLRSSYRNFFYPQDRWQFSGLRLARTLA